MKTYNNAKVYKKVVAEIIPMYNKKNELPVIHINSSHTAQLYIRDFYPVNLNHKEAFIALYLNRANNVQGFAIISTGGLSGTVSDPKMIFQSALLCNAAAVIVAHNHPSGNRQPSQQDIHITKRLKDVGLALDCPVLDHLIITEESFLSFADEGLL